jgi:ribosomal protein S27E
MSELLNLKVCPKCNFSHSSSTAIYCVQCGHRFGVPSGDSFLEMFKNIVKEEKNERTK